MTAAIANTIDAPPLSRRKGWKTVGWQGLTMQAPPEWNLVAYGGDRKAGNFRLDNSSLGDNAPVGMDVRWSQVKGKLTESDLEKRLEPFHKSITKTARRQNLVAETKSKPVSDDRHPDRGATRSFIWKSDRKAVGRMWHCTECGRFVIAQVVGGARDEFGGIAADVLASLECHSSEAGWQTWSLYDLLTGAPSDYALKGQPQLMNIYVQLGFARGQTLDTLTVEQWGVANVQLKNRYLDEWFRQKNGALEPTVRYQAEESEAQGHTALALTGRRCGVSYWAGQAAPQLLKLHRPALHYAARIWECPDSNKIHLVQSFSRRPQPELIQEIVERTQCHC